MSVVLHPDVLIPDLLRAAPQARAVLDRFGLRGCGGDGGPHETLRFFAQTHGVEEDRLLADLRRVLEDPAAAAAARRAVTATAAVRSVDSIYRRYFLGGIAVILSAGAVWGAWLLWKIGFAGSFTGVGIHEVNAHGHAQIFGWLGLFIMGFDDDPGHRRAGGGRA